MAHHFETVITCPVLTAATVQWLSGDYGYYSGHDYVKVCTEEIDITGHVSELKRFDVKKNMLK